jgi:hypothetical protein
LGGIRHVLLVLQDAINGLVYVSFMVDSWRFRR